MGWSVGWFAISDSSPAVLAAEMGYTVGDELDSVEGLCVAEIGEWTLVYSDEGKPMLGDGALRSMSVGRSVVVHESIDSVMYARSAQWSSGDLSWSAVVNLDTLDDDSAVVTEGLSKSADQKLRRSYRSSGSSAYGDIAEMARRAVGFRHDRPGNIRARSLIDDRPKPASTPDRVARWLVAQGFEAEHSTADGKDHRRFRCHIEGPYWVIVEVKRDRYQFSEDWCDVNVLIRHDALVEVDDNRYRALGDFVGTASFTYMVHGGRGNERPHSTEEQPFEAVTASIQALINQAISYCTDEKLLRICDPSQALVLEITLGWSNRAESALEEAVAHNNLAAPHDHVPLSWVEEHRDVTRAIEPVVVEQSVAELQQRLDNDEVLSGPELAVLQANVGGSDEMLDALRFDHWLRFFTMGAAHPAIAAHAARHNLFISEAAHLARYADLPVEVELVFSGHQHPNVPFQLGYNPNIKPATQERLAEKGVDDTGVVGLAGNPALSAELRPMFAASTHYQVREAVAANPGTSEELLKKLLKDRKRDVKQAAARNPLLPDSLQVTVFEKGSKDAKIGLRANQGMCEEVQRRIVELGEIESIGSNQALVSDLMEILVSSEDGALRLKVAANRALPRDMQQRLAHDTDPAVRRQLARNEMVDPEILAQLETDAV